ncbi:MAG: kelch repeat-containing protein, partial [Thaumarchaeota archaeon]|nr:kelch repeat-containing protein [Nitrososphaerota archaeon]
MRAAPIALIVAVILLVPAAHAQIISPGEGGQSPPRPAPSPSLVPGPVERGTPTLPLPSPQGGTATADAGPSLWASHARMAVSRSELAVVAVGTTVYAIAGLDASGRAMATLEAYDTVSGEWEARA